MLRTGNPLSVELGPGDNSIIIYIYISYYSFPAFTIIGIMGNIFDGIQRPLKVRFDVDMIILIFSQIHLIN